MIGEQSTEPSRKHDADTLIEFFAAFRQQSAAVRGELESFFQKFAQDYQIARSERATTTPHLDVLRVFGLDFAELRHSAVLAWFLKSDSEHEQGALFADALLRWCKTAPLHNERYSVVRERHGRTDVAIYAAEDFAIFVENKVRHFEREKQVADMVDSMTTVCKQHSIPPHRRFAIFLTDTGVASVTGPPQDSADFLRSNLRSVRRVELFECFRAALIERVEYSALLLNFLDSYLRAIRRLRVSL